MGFLDRLLGRQPLQDQQARPTGRPYDVPAPSRGASSEDERAIARYKYLLRTAPPEDVERVHAEAFGRLSPEQRQQVLSRMSEDLPQAEQPRTAEPADLARAATRAEMRQPGYMQRSFGGGGMGMGGMFAGSMLGTIAGFVVGSAIADAMLGGYDQSPEAAEAGDTGSDTGDTGGDAGADAGADSGGDQAAGDAGGDAGGGFGDFGGGDFGGDFGGGDFGGGF